MSARRRGDRARNPAARDTTALPQRPTSIAPTAIAGTADLAPELDDSTTAAVLVDLLGRLEDGQVAGAVEDLHRLPDELHRAVLIEAGTRTDLDRAEGGALSAGGWL